MDNFSNPETIPEVGPVEFVNFFTTDAAIADKILEIPDIGQKLLNACCTLSKQKMKEFAEITGLQFFVLYEMISRCNEEQLFILANIFTEAGNILGIRICLRFLRKKSKKSRGK